MHMTDEPSDDRRIEMADKKTKEKNVCRTKEGSYTGRDSCRVAPHQLKSVYTGRQQRQEETPV